jgi:hypothetical protein
MIDGGPLEVVPILDLLTQILQELQELNQAVRELPSQIAAEISGRL